MRTPRRQSQARLTLSHVVTDDDGANTLDEYGAALAAFLTPLPAAVSADQQAPVSKSGFTALIVARDDVKIGDHCETTTASGQVFVQQVTRVAMRPGRPVDHAELRLEDA